MRFFLTEIDSTFYLREMSRQLGIHLNALRREIENLKKIGFLKELSNKELKELGIERKGKIKKKYYQVNKNFVLYPELKALVTKSQLLLRNSLVKKIQKAGKVHLIILTGIFTGVPNTQTDILIVGRINRKKIKRIIRKFERELERPIFYTIMTQREFINRRELTDRFIFNILENRKIILLNNSKLKSKIR